MADFPLELRHIAGRKNRADPLSRRPDFDDGSKDNEEVVALPDKLFARIIEAMALDQMVEDAQKDSHSTMKEWAGMHNLRQDAQGKWFKGIALAVPPIEPLQRGLVELNHDTPTAVHPGINKMHRSMLKQYWWPHCREFVPQSVKGCAVCQANKPITHRNNPPLNPITPQGEPLPFQTIAVDFIVKLPLSGGYDAIMTVADHDCTKAVILVPCNETIDAEGVAKLYKDRVFPYAGLPKRIISDRDPRFTSAFFKELCIQLEIKQTLSTAYHPQTVGQSEKMNQHVEMALRIYCNYQQDNWAEMLPIVQYAINARASATTKQAPFELWMGFIPRAHQPDRPSDVPTIERHKETILTARRNAREAMRKAQELLGRKSNHRPYQKGQKVWLEGTNLQTTHPTAKLRPKRYGPFKVTEVIGATTYRLELPAQWRIHNAFHASLLLPYQETPEHGRNFAEPPPDLVEGQPEWEVEDILNSRVRQHKTQYLVKWKGYSDAHNSWEPKEHLHAPELLSTYHKRHQAAIRTMKRISNDCVLGAQVVRPGIKDTKPRNEPSTLRRRPMRIRSLRMGDEPSMSSERPQSPTPAEASRLRRRPTPQIVLYSDDTLFQSRDPATRSAWTAAIRPSDAPFRPPIRGIFAQRFASRSPDLQGSTLVTPSPVESSTSLPVPSGSTRPVRQQHLLPGLPTSIAVVSSLPEASAASGNTAQGQVSAPDEDSSPIPTISDPILGLIDHFHHLSFEERRAVHQQLSSLPTEPPTTDHIAQPEVFPEEFLNIDPTLLALDHISHDAGRRGSPGLPERENEGAAPPLPPDREQLASVRSDPGTTDVPRRGGWQGRRGGAR